LQGRTQERESNKLSRRTGRKGRTLTFTGRFEGPNPNIGRKEAPYSNWPFSC